MRAGWQLPVVLLTVVAVTACSSSDGRELADPDPDLTATSAAPAAAEAAAPGSQEASSVPPSSLGPGGLSVTSPAFEPGGPLPPRYTCVGDDTSPPLEWSSVPAGTVELVVVTRNSTAGNALHWLVAGIDPARAGLPEDEQPAAIVPWSGPCPTPGTQQQYVFSLYALRQPLDAAAGIRADAVVDRLESAAPPRATVTATFTR